MNIIGPKLFDNYNDGPDFEELLRRFVRALTKEQREIHRSHLRMMLQDYLDNEPRVMKLGNTYNWVEELIDDSQGSIFLDLK